MATSQNVGCFLRVQNLQKGKVENGGQTKFRLFSLKLSPFITFQSNRIFKISKGRFLGQKRGPV